MRGWRNIRFDGRISGRTDGCVGGWVGLENRCTGNHLESERARGGG